MSLPKAQLLETDQETSPKLRESKKFITFTATMTKSMEEEDTNTAVFHAVLHK